MEFVLTAARGTERWVAQEACALGADSAPCSPGLVRVSGDLRLAYRLCLWSRVANRVLLPLASFPCDDAQTLYDGVRAVEWEKHLDPRKTLAVHVSGSGNEHLRHSLFAAQKAKDAIVDRMREARGERPRVDPRSPEAVIHLHLAPPMATVAIDLSGEPLFKRAYRTQQHTAPLKETLAAALLYFAGWHETARCGQPFLDPFCGSGTLAIEAAWMAANVPPGLLRKRFGFHAWLGHAERLWQEVRAEARACAREQPTLVAVHASDHDPRALAAAREHARRAGVERAIQFTLAKAEERTLPSNGPGVMVTNPPYGSRLQAEAVSLLYARFGDTLRRRFLGWTAWILTANRAAAKRIGLRPARRIPLWNGPMECRLLCFPIHDTPVTRAEPPRWRLEPPSE